MEPSMCGKVSTRVRGSPAELPWSSKANFVKKELGGVQESQGAGSTHGRPKRRQRWLILLGIGLPLLFIGLVLALFLLFLNLTRPSHDLVQSSLSPDGRSTVEVFYVNPGAMASAWMVVEAKPTAGGKKEKLAELGGEDLGKATWGNENQLTVQWESPTSLLVGGYPMEIGGDNKTQLLEDKQKVQEFSRKASFPILWLGEQYQGASFLQMQLWGSDTVTLVYATADFSRTIYIREDNLGTHPGRATLYSTLPYVREVPLQKMTGKMYAPFNRVLVFQDGDVLCYISDSAVPGYPDEDEQLLTTTAAGLKPVP
jgi:hypothetical protein